MPFEWIKKRLNRKRNKSGLRLTRPSAMSRSKLREDTLSSQRSTIRLSTDLVDDDRLDLIRQNILSTSNRNVGADSNISLSRVMEHINSPQLRTSDDDSIDHPGGSRGFESMHAEAYEIDKSRDFRKMSFRTRPYSLDKSLTSDKSVKSANLRRKNSKISFQTHSIKVNEEDIQESDADNHLVATPIDVKLHKGEKLTLSKALGALVNHEEEISEGNILIHKDPVSSFTETSSDEEDYKSLTTSALYLASKSGTAPKRTKAKSESILTKKMSDKSVGTSIFIESLPEQKQPQMNQPPQNSLIQIKFRSQLNEGSCTQYFAIRSPLQVEPYLRELKALEEIRQNLPPVPKDLPNQPEIEVPKQKAYMDLSKVTIAEEGWKADIEDGPKPQKKSVVNKHRVSQIDSVTSIHRKHRCNRCTEASAMDAAKRRESEKFAGSVHGEVRDSNILRMLESTDVDELDGNERFTLVILQIEPHQPLLNYSYNTFDTDDFQGYRLKWKFLNQSDSITFQLNSTGIHYLNYFRSYNFKITPATYIYLLKCPLAIELYVLNDENETLIGKCTLKIGKSFQGIRKIYESTLEINNSDLCLCFPQLTPVVLGYLICRCTFKGDPEVYKSCEPPPLNPVRIPPIRDVSTTSLNSVIMPRNYSFTLSIVNEAELQAFQDGLNLVLVRNKALRTTQQEISNELKERTTWMHEELKWRLTLQENAILCGKDPESVKWRQWKDETTANVKYRPIAHDEYFTNHVAEIEIEIVEMNLLPDSKVMLDENVTHIYMEYKFLTYSGVSMETPTLKKPDDDQPINFKFKKSFRIELSQPEATILANMIKNNSSVNFIAISQPIEDITELQSCYDFGVAKLKLFDLLQHRSNVVVEFVPIYDIYNKNITFGTVKIKFSGVLAMRSMALRILTPASFKIIR